MGAIDATNELFQNRDSPPGLQPHAREAALLAALRHPAIPSLHDCTPFDG
jgi:hypothetical protein